MSQYFLDTQIPPFCITNKCSKKSLHNDIRLDVFLFRLRNRMSDETGHLCYTGAQSTDGVWPSFLCDYVTSDRDLVT